MHEYAAAIYSRYKHIIAAYYYSLVELQLRSFHAAYFNRSIRLCTFSQLLHVYNDDVSF